MSELFEHFLAAAAVLGCQTTAATTRAPRAPDPIPAMTATPAATAAEPAPARKIGEHPNVACRAPHPIAELPLRSVNVDDWAQAVAGYHPEASSGRPVGWEGAEGDLNAYLENVHACVHQAFADSFLASLETLPKDHPLSDPTLEATIEIVIDGESGALAKAGVVGSSGVPEFDAAAVASFTHAFPLAAPPEATLSSDGRLYVTWELHRNPEEACRREQARPWKLRF